MQPHDKTNFRAGPGTGLAITIKCIDCNKPRQFLGARRVKGTRMYRCAECVKARADAKQAHPSTTSQP